MDDDHIKAFLDKLNKLESTAQLEVWKDAINNHPFDLDQLRSLKEVIDNRIKLDIISNVPYEIALHIMSFLGPKDLCRASQTCRSWKIICDDNRLWRKRSLALGMLDDQHTIETIFNHEKNLIKNLVDCPQNYWKQACLKLLDILRNWESRFFDMSNPFVASPLSLNLSLPTVFLHPQTLRNSLINSDDSNSDSKKVKSVAKRSFPFAKSSYSPTDLFGSRSSRDKLMKLNSDINSSTDGQPSTSSAENKQHPKLIQMRCHEDSFITCLQYNPKSRIIVSGSTDSTLKIWSSDTGRCLTTLRGHTGGVWSSQLSPDDIVVSGSIDRTVRVWTAKTGESLHTLCGHSSTVRCLALDGKLVVSGSRDKTLRLWDIEQGTCVHVFVGHEGSVRCVEFKNNIIVSGSYDKLVMVWDATTGLCRHVLKKHTENIYSLQFDGRTIASGSFDKTINIWDAQTGKLKHHLLGHSSLTSKMKLKGNTLVSANADSSCKIWDINTGNCLHSLEGPNQHRAAVTSVYINEVHVVTSSYDGTVKLWDIKTGDFIRDLVVLPNAGNGGVVWTIRASLTKLICAVGSRSEEDIEDTQLLVLDFNE